MATSSFLLPCYTLLKLFYFLLLIEKISLVSVRGLTGEYNLIDVESLMPSSSCSVPHNGTSPYKLKLVDRYGPCSPLGNQNNLSLVEQYDLIMQQDQSRVDYIHHLAVANTSSFNPLDARVPTNEGRSLGSNNFIVTIGLGTPPKFFSVEIDTGSDLTWIQCKPCDLCHKQKDPIYDPHESSTFRTISCFSIYYSQLKRHSCNWWTFFDCLYELQYGDDSITKGSLIKDTLRLSSDVIHNFRFGCGHLNRGIFEMEDGLLGLGQGSVSIISQAPQLYGKVFSYCLPSKPTIDGYLALGSSATGVQYTLMLRSIKYPSFYFVNLDSIYVNHEKIELPPNEFGFPATMLDSGSVITRLLPITYSALRITFRKHMAKYRTAT
ncbi:aspartyl protease family protein At5g10770-like [Dendrobium catenatum]|uniref:aspartyl protease family protein At5g10770-like n=1 Tax=Dendrobium catenatum TaxID=906689 RepID=UPI0009F295D7|nr:aspartyl protease family protein At5g10770-like [Dendrobium catenatum]